MEESRAHMEESTESPSASPLIVLLPPSLQSFALPRHNFCVGLESIRRPECILSSVNRCLDSVHNGRTS